MRARITSLILILGVMLVFLLTGCATTTPHQNDYSGRYVNIIDNVAYYQITGEFYLSDAKDLWSDLTRFKSNGVNTIDIYLDSPGGLVFTCFAYVDALRKAQSEGIKVVIEAHGIIASAAVPVLVMADYRTAGANTIFMLHKPDDTKADEADRKAMDTIHPTYCKILAEYTKLDMTEIVELTSIVGSWFNAYKALEWGFIDEIV